MNRILIILTLIFMMQDQLIAEKPEAIEGYEFEFPEYDIEVTSNNIKLILLQDDEQPITNLRLIIGGGSSIEPKPGVAELTASMLYKGAGGLSAFQIAQKLDGIGAQLSINSNDDMIIVSLEVLNKHLEEALQIFEKIINNPTFDEDELDKLKQLVKASITADKANPGSLAGKLSKKVIFGEDHPYASNPSEEDIDKISVEDLKKFYDKILHARNMSLAIYGDFSDDMVDVIAATLTDIKDDKETKPVIDIPTTETMPKGVYFIPRSGSVQSTIRVLFPAPEYKNNDYEILSFTGNIIGASFTGRLFKTLREKHAYTYTPSAGVTQRKYNNYFYAAADVKESVTDSAINVINDQIFDLLENNVEEEELSSIKKYRSGRYQMNFENASFIVSMIQNAEFKGKNARTLESYIDRLENFSSSQVKLVSKEYLDRNNARIVVVGPESVKEDLKQFGKIYTYNKDIEPDAGYQSVEIDADDLIDNYIEAIEKSEDLDDVESLFTSGTGTATMAANQVPIELKEYREAGGKFYQKIDFAGMAQEKWININKSWISAGGVLNEMPLTDDLKLEAQIFALAKLEDMTYSMKVLGKQDNMLFLKAASPNGSETIYRFDASTYLLLGSSSIEDSPQGQIEIETKLSNYKDFGGILFPTTISINSQMFSYDVEMNYEINKKQDYKFEPDSK